jgi:hypothetical protein
MRGLVGTLLVGAAILLAVGCGGKSNDATGKPVVVTDTIAAETTSTDTSTTDTTATDTTMTATGTTAIGLTAGCQKVADLSVQFGKALSAAGASGSTDLEKTAKAYESFAQEVPEEIRESFVTLAKAYAQYAVALKGLHLEAGQVPDASTMAKLAQAARSLNGVKLTEANTRISTWVSDNCSGTR